MDLHTRLCSLSSRCDFLISSFAVGAPVLRAPIPSWVEYDESQIKMFKSPENVEDEFSGLFGPKIPEDYVGRFGIMMQEIRKCIAARSSGFQTIACHVVSLTCRVNSNTVSISVVKVRPCAEDLKLLKVIMWCVVQSCIRFEKELCLLLLADKTMDMLVKSNIKSEISEVSCYITVETMQGLSLNMFGLSDYFQDDAVNENMFPPASEMNDQNTVDGRRSAPRGPRPVL